VDFTVIVKIKFVKQPSALFGRDLNAEVAKSFPEFLNVETARAIIIHDFEHTLHPQNSSGSSLRKLLPEHYDHLIVSFLDTSILRGVHALWFVYPLHLWVAIDAGPGLGAPTCRGNHLFLINIFKCSRSCGLPLCLALLFKWSCGISAKQISMEIVSICVSWIYSCDLPWWASKRHKFWLSLLVTPNASHQEIEECIWLYAHGSKWVETNELF